MGYSINIISVVTYNNCRWYRNVRTIRKIEGGRSVGIKTNKCNKRKEAYIEWGCYITIT